MRIDKSRNFNYKSVCAHFFVQADFRKGTVIMIVISLLNRKGGAGKTTASVNLAAIFAELKGKRVLLADIDPQANATTYLDKYIRKPVFTMLFAMIFRQDLPLLIPTSMI